MSTHEARRARSHAPAAVSSTASRRACSSAARRFGCACWRRSPASTCLIGPPGTARASSRAGCTSVRRRAVFRAPADALLDPEELFGPLSLKALEDDRYERLTAGYLPTAGIAFLDEVFKGQLGDPERAADLAQRARVRQRHRPLSRTARASSRRPTKCRRRVSARLPRPLPAPRCGGTGQRRVVLRC